MVKGQQGYGFNLHSDKKKRGQFVRAVDPDSPAESSGMRPGDRILQVNFFFFLNTWWLLEVFIYLSLILG